MNSRHGPRAAAKGRGNAMEIVIAAVVVALGLAAGLVIAAGVLAKRAPGVASATAVTTPAKRVPAARPPTAERTEDGRAAERLHAREEALEQRQADVAERERRMSAREQEIDEVRDKAVRALERASGMSASQAKAMLL